MTPEEQASQEFDIDSYKFPPGVPLDLQESLKRDFKLSQRLQKYMLEVAEKMKSSNMEFTPTEKFDMTWEDLQREVNRIALEEFGIEYGVPLPSMTEINRPMILAPGTPLHHLPPPARTHLEEDLVRENPELKIRIRNSWTQLGDQDICIIDTAEGPMALPRYHSGTRLRNLMDTALMRSGTSQTVESEMRAMESLRQRINGRQYESYVLNGMFPEHSEASGIHYFLRKGYPTVAISYRPGIKDNSGGRVLAALCLHPMGYYDGTRCGLMCPTDEVICHLLMMRGDEHKYWAKCGQWSAVDPRSGL